MERCPEAGFIGRCNGVRAFIDLKPEPDSNYFNWRTGVTLPCDSILNNKEELAKLSGPVITYYLKGSETGEMPVSRVQGGSRQNLGARSSL